MKIDKITMKEPFKSLFPIDPLISAAIQESMNNNGYDNSKPIDIWKGKNIIIDGNTRFLIAQKLGIEDVPVFEHEFLSEEEALTYSIHNQRNRRNLTEADILRCIAIVDKRRERGGDRKSEKVRNQNIDSNILIPNNRSHLETAKTVGVGQTKVQEARTVLQNEDLKNEVLEGKKSIHKAYQEAQEKKKINRVSEFNFTNENIEWAKRSWNPVTGCKHGCEYCYARDIANRFYNEKFEPTFRPERLDDPKNTKLPSSEDIGSKSVFVCSMADLFGEWVPEEWITSVMKSVKDNPKWNFIFLTKNPKRLLKIDWPDNCWVGTTVDKQSRVKMAEVVFSKLKAKVKFVSCEPMQEKLSFSNLGVFDWIIIGGRSPSSGTPAFQPEWEWVENLLLQARKAECKVYFKPNLEVRPKEYPSK